MTVTVKIGFDAPGDMPKRIFIRDKSHPWYGHTGYLTDEILPTGQLVAFLDNGQSTGVYVRQVEVIK